MLIRYETLRRGRRASRNQVEKHADAAVRGCFIKWELYFQDWSTVALYKVKYPPLVESSMQKLPQETQNRVKISEWHFKKTKTTPTCCIKELSSFFKTWKWANGSSEYSPRGALNNLSPTTWRQRWPCLHICECNIKHNLPWITACVW